MKNPLIKLLAAALVVIMLVGMVPVYAFAAIDYNEGADDYYKLISQKNWELAPGINESEIVINNEAGDRRQVMHVVEVDIHNPYTKVIPSTYMMADGLENKKYSTQTMDKQAAYAEANGYGNVVAAMNISLSWYDSTYYDQHPELAGEPLGYLVLDGQVYKNSQGQTSGAQTCLVIHFDEKDGVARPADIPKTQIRSTKDPITGWEEQVIPANFGFLVKDGKMVNTKEEHTSEGASRSMLGIKADGTIIMVMNDGRQAPYSTGFNSYEMSEAMLKLGCVYAINGDGGGSSQFLSQRPGEELEVHCSPSDGALRATTHGVLVISTAPSTGEFVRAHVEAESAYYTSGSSIQFKAIGADLAGGAAEIPEEAYWTLSDPSFGTIDNNGLFVSNGKQGKVSAQLVYNGEIKGSAEVNLVVPDAIAFGNAETYTVPFGEKIALNVTATYDVFDVVLKASDYTITLDNNLLGTLIGNEFTAGEIAGAANMTVTLNANPAVFKTIPLKVGKGSEVIFDFEEGTPGADLNNWVIKDHEGKYSPYSDISIVTAENGMVHNGNSALAVHMPTHQHVDGGEGYNANSITWVGDRILLKDAVSIGIWIYIPEEATQTEIALNYVWYNNNGVQQRTTPDLCLNDTFNGIQTSGWYYLSVPISKSMAYIEDAKDVAASQGYKRNFFLKFYVTNSGNAGDESSYSGDITYYIDDITVDYSDAVVDRIKPTILNTYVRDITTEIDVTLSADKSVLVKNGEVSFTATVSDNLMLDASSACVYVDGKPLATTYNNGRMTADAVLGAGVHRVVYEIADANGNMTRAVRYITVAGDDIAVNVVPRNPAQTVALSGSVYWLDVVASDAENVDQITMKLDLDTMNEWDLDHAELLYGYEIEYYYATVADAKENVVTIVLTNMGVVVTGDAVIASLPIRVWSYCGNATSSAITPAEAWTKGYVTAVSVNVEVELGEVLYADDSLATFSADKIHIDTEAYIHQYKMDKTYFATNTYHEHTPEAVADLAPTCTKDGYTGRTYCAVCDSIVDWGTKIPATGHTYAVVDGMLVCDCGHTITETGLIYVDGKTYYAVKGNLKSGWISIDDEWYFFDATTFVGADGETVADNGIAFIFDQGRLTKGSWVTTSAGTRYWYGPGYYRDTSMDADSCRPYEIDGKTYLFSRAGYMQTGIVRYLYAYTTDDSSIVNYYYDCGTTGEAVLLAGPYNNRFYKDGQPMNAYQLVEYKGDFYFISDGNKLAKNTKIYLTAKNVEGKTFADGTPIAVGSYRFDAEGKLVIPSPAERKNGIVNDYFYIDDVKQPAYQLVEFDGNLYFISDGNKIAKNTKIYLTAKNVEGKTFADGTPIPVGRYYFDAEGKLVVPTTPDEPTPEARNGIYNGYLYINDVKQLAYKLVEFDGNLYFISDGNKVAMNTYAYMTAANIGSLTFADGTPIPVGRYYFDAEGKLVIPETPDEPAPEARNGIYNGSLYINDVKQLAYKLVEFEGDFYFVSDGHKVAKNTYAYMTASNIGDLTFENGDPIPVGRYFFDADGKMVID